ncbi:MAG: hypothetical protein IPG39_15430 [Bacteroidetes bacterium]|nr:hypothetical protein [Bacteroidota bacterium]
MESNAKILKNWKDRHIKIRNRITEIIEGKNDSLKIELLKHNFLNLGILTDIKFGRCNIDDYSMGIREIDWYNIRI